MALRSNALDRFEPDTFALKTINATDYFNALKETGQRFCFTGMISRMPTACDIDAADANNITFRDRKDMIDSYGQVQMEHVQCFATMIWGNKTWTITADKEINDPTTARDELTAGGNALTAAGKKLMLQRFHNEILANCILKQLDPAGRKAIMVEKEKFQWVHPMSGQLINDGPTMLHIVLRKFRPNKLITVFNEIAKLKKILPAQHDNDISEWDTAIEAARIDIETMLPNEYSETAFINDYFTALLTVEARSFTSEITSMKQKWQLGTPLSMEDMRTTVGQLYINLKEDGIWKRELAEVSQIIALASQIDDLKKQFKTTVALATTTGGGSGSGSGSGGTSNTKKPNNVEDWRFKFDGETKTVNEKEWHWCKEKHYANGNEVHGLYVRCHGKGGHEAWQKTMNEQYAQRKAAREAKQGSTTSDSKTVVNDATKKKLALSERLRTAMTTQAGLSQEAFNRIYAECDGDSAKD